MADDLRSGGRIVSPDLDLLWTLPVIAFVGAFTVLPAIALFGGGLVSGGGVSGLAHLLADPLDQRAIGNSLLEGGASALAAFAIGYPVGVFLGRTAFRGRSLLLATLLVPFLLPTIAVVVGIEEWFGPAGIVSGALPPLAALGSGFGGIVASNVLFNAPVVILLTVVGVGSASAELEETVATLGGSPARAFREVWGGPSLLGAFAGALLTFVFSALAFAGPILIGGAKWYTLEAEVYVQASTLAQAMPAALLALVGVLLLAGPAALFALTSAKLRPTTRRRAAEPRPFDPARPSHWILGAWTVVVGGGIIALLATIVVRGLSPLARAPTTEDPLATLFGSHVTSLLGLSTSGALANTLLYAGLSSAAALLLALLAARGIARRPGLERALGALAFTPLLISPVVLSFALSRTYSAGLGGASAAPVLIIVSQATLALPFVLQSLTIALASTSPAPAEAARTLGATPRQAYLDIELPAIAPALRTSALFGLALGLGEFTATNFLATPSSTTLTVEAYRLEGIRLPGLAGTVAALLVLTSLVVFGATAAWGEPSARPL